MLSMTRKSGYALIALTHLAKLPRGTLASARGIAQEYRIPQALLMNVLKELSGAGYLESVRGARGGYRLSRRAEEMALLPILESLEGPVRLADCMSGDGEDLEGCDLLCNCPIANPIHHLQKRMRTFLRRLTLQDLLMASGENIGADNPMMLHDI